MTTGVSRFVRQAEVTKKPAPQWTGFSFTLSPSGLAFIPRSVSGIDLEYHSPIT
jgi:hypothetical protein